MDDLLQKQIVESCRLALPNGLKELMSDLSREVLRAQPNNLYKFITDYLSSLLVTRDNMTIAARVCSNLCECVCEPELGDELRYIGLDEETASKAKQVIEEFLGKGEVDEGHLLLRLMKKTSLSEDQLPAVTEATRRAFLRHLRNRTQIYESSSSSDDDETASAVRNTLRLYRKTDLGPETYNCMAKKIQASYRAYKVRRQMDTRKSSHSSKKSSKTGSLEKSKVTFGTVDSKICTNAHEDICEEDSEGSKDLGESKTHKKTSITSLAGSYLSLPNYEPYSAHDCENLASYEQLPEKERSNFDYTEEILSNNYILGSKGEANDKQTDIGLEGYEEDHYSEESTENDVEIEDITEELLETDKEKNYEVTTGDVQEETTVYGEEIEDDTESVWKKSQEVFDEATLGQVKAEKPVEEIIDTTNSLSKTNHGDYDEGNFEEEITNNGDEMANISKDLWETVPEEFEGTIFEEVYEKRTVNSEDMVSADDVSGSNEENIEETELSEAESEFETVDDNMPEVSKNIDEGD